MKTRILPNNNYRAIFHNGKTMRFALDSTKPITKLSFPEFYDCKITNYCTGNCQECYMSSTPQGKHFTNIPAKINNFFGQMSENDRPFQVAIGGGNPNEHHEFVTILQTFNSLGIVPNYTTNGIGLTDAILKATVDYCGGVAVSCHPHLKMHWSGAITSLIERKIFTNTHHIISDSDSITNFITIFNEYKNSIKYFVLLPYSAQGRGREKDCAFDYLFSKLKEFNKEDIKKIAFGANFYEYLKKESLPVSLYEPELFSEYLDMDDMVLYPSSFNLKPIRKV